jgi:hypothetical protein
MRDKCAALEERFRSTRNGRRDSKNNVVLHVQMIIIIIKEDREESSVAEGGEEERGGEGEEGCKREREKEYDG